MQLNFSEQGEGHAVILMHGMFGSLSNLGNLARHLATQCRVISVDLRNHGDSPHESIMDIPSMANDVVELMDDLALSEASLVGHSLGGKVAMQVALNYSERVTTLVVADISPIAYSPRQDAALDALTQLSLANVLNRAEADALVAVHVPQAQTRAFLLKNLVRNLQGSYQLKLNMSVVGANYGTTLVAAPDGLPYQGPSLFLKGENSAYIQTKHQPIISQLFPNSEIRIIEGVGHWLHAEKPDEFNTNVTEFINSP
jgi:esterase